MINDREVLRPAEVAELLGVTAASLNNWHRQGAFRADFVTPGGHRRYTRQSVESFLETLKHESGNTTTVSC